MTEDDIVVGTVCVLYTDIWRRVKVEYAIDLDFGLRDVDTGEFLTNVPLSSLHKLVSPFNMHKFLVSSSIYKKNKFSFIYFIF